MVDCRFRDDGVALTFLRGLGFKINDLGFVFPRDLPDNYPTRNDSPLPFGYLDCGDLSFRHAESSVIAKYHNQTTRAYEEQFGALM